METPGNSQIEISELNLDPEAVAEIKKIPRYESVEMLSIVIDMTFRPYQKFLFIKGVMVTLIKRSADLHKTGKNVSDAIMEIINYLEQNGRLTPVDIAETLIAIRDS
jgi:hypothetical protein